jgi:hypothetical protein
LRLALADAWPLLGLNVFAGIEPDQQTARVAAELLKKLVPFAVLSTKTGLARLLDETPPRVIVGLLWAGVGSGHASESTVGPDAKRRG